MKKDWSWYLVMFIIIILIIFGISAIVYIMNMEIAIHTAVNSGLIF